MSFADIINQAQKNLEQGGDNPKVEYPKAKHKKLYFSKETPKLLIQILPDAALTGNFFVPIRTVYLNTITGNGKQFGSSFVLDAAANPGSLLEQKITEWAGLGMIPNGFGGQQSPTERFLVNAVLVIQHPMNPQQWVQERDPQGNLVVRVLELPKTALLSVFDKLKNKMLNRTGTELSFMDINSPRPIEITKPPQGKKEYTVELYNDIVLPALGQGWETQLEDLNAHAVPTERLVNGMQWVQAFIDMKEGRKPNQGGAAAPAPGAPAANPYGAAAPQPGAPNPYANVPAPNPYAAQPGAQPGAPVPNPYAQNAAPQPNPYANVPQPGAQPNPYAAQPGVGAPAPTPAAPAPNPYANVPQPGAPAVPQQPVTPAPNPYANTTAPTPIDPFAPSAVPTQPVINMPTGMDEPTDIGEETNLANNGGVAPTPPAPVPPAAPAPGATPPLHNVPANGNGLNNLDAMLEKELGGGQQ
ncbi:single strand DNA binding protein [Bacillus phage TsarBomba]|uniref:SsDNA binding domain protein n=1 Tax=Bacillus phage TsarBomba TaxID=1690456 RepID=A0A0K2CZS6_9CAUD|nr:single strand DNA binding protein [Bacillus phage TsarBomba]ALA13049.1 ssDNA binding domain protein [Bacillus phage TsarBomba]